MSGNKRSAHNPVRYINVLDRHCREDYGSILFFLPRPERAVDGLARDCLADLWAQGAARRRWLVSADEAAGLLRFSHPHLFTPEPVCFEVYRVDRVRLNRVLAKL